jgi:hypothetical protein
MGAKGNAAIVRRAYEAFNTADMKTLTELFDENATWYTPGRGILAGDRKGREAVFAQFVRYGQKAFVPEMPWALRTRRHRSAASGETRNVRAMTELKRTPMSDIAKTPCNQNGVFLQQNERRINGIAAPTTQFVGQ